MELRVLRYFLAVADAGNLTRAAERLHMTQPSLSRQLGALERELGCQLLVRGKRGVSLTPEGRSFARRAQDLVSLADRLESDYYSKGASIGGSLTIGSVEAYSADVMPKLVGAFLREAPEVHIEIFTGNADEVVARLDEGTVDFGILREPIDLARFDTLPLPKPDLWGVLVPEGSPLGERKELVPADLAEERLLLPTRGALSHEILSWFKEGELSLEPMSYNALSAAIWMVLGGVGCAICPSIAETMAGDRARFVPLAPRHETRGRLAWKQNLSWEPAASLFIEVARRQLDSGA